MPKILALSRQPGTLGDTLNQCARQYLVNALANNKTVKGAARAAGVNRTSFYKMLKQYGLDPPRTGRTQHRGQWERPIPENF